MMTRVHKLEIKILSNDPDVIEYYNNLAKMDKIPSNSGIDLIYPKDYFVNTDGVEFVGLGIA